MRWPYLSSVLATFVAVLAAGLLFLIQEHGPDLLHSIAELGGLVVAFAIFAIAWQGRDYSDNGFLLFIGMAYLFVGLMDFAHLLSHQGLAAPAVLSEPWMAARLLEALAVLAAALNGRRMLPVPALLVGLGAAALMILAGLTTLGQDLFTLPGGGPSAGRAAIAGLTATAFTAAAVIVLQRRAMLGDGCRRPVALAFALSAGAEFLLIGDPGPHLAAGLGFLFKLGAVLLLYRAIVRGSFQRPMEALFRDLSSARLALESKVAQRTAALAEANVKLRQSLSSHRRTEEKLQAAVAELERSNAELEQFAYAISHDLQEPLRMVLSFTQLLDRRYHGRLGQDADEFIAFASDGASRMDGMIRDLLEYSRVHRQGRPLEPIAAQEAVAEALSNLRQAIADSGAIVEVGEMPMVMADGGQLARLFQNLIGNAVKYRYVDRAATIRIAARREGEAWHFTVADNGIGIEPRDFGRLFTIFQRLNPRSEYPGSGVGLAICKRIVERHGGRIWVGSEPGRGSVFHFTLTAPAADRAAA